MMSLRAIAKASNATIIGLDHGADVLVSSLCTDSRNDCTDQLFAAIPGERFDGHDFVETALKAGASATLVERQLDVAIPQLKVDSIMQAMADCATAWRQTFAVPVVAITGSAGKTTVKEMLGGVLTLEFGQGVITHGNFNNEIGVPLTVTRLSELDKFAVVEMGMNHPGEISRLSSMTQPNFALINNATAAHLEGVGGVADVANAKGEIVDGLDDDGILFVNLDDKFSDQWLDSRKGKTNITFGLNDDADVSCDYEVKTSEASTSSKAATVHMNVSAFGSKYQVELAVLGEHNVRNALAVIAIAHQMGVSQDNIIQGLESFQPPENRAGKTQLTKNIEIINDTYNANLASMCAAIDVLNIESTVSPNTETVLVLGDIGELGNHAAAIHQEIGAYAQQKGVDQLLVVGDFAQEYAKGYGDNAQLFADKDSLTKALKEKVNEHADTDGSMTILVKGSRFTRMEKVVEAINAEFNANCNNDFESKKSQNVGAH